MEYPLISLQCVFYLLKVERERKLCYERAMYTRHQIPSSSTGFFSLTSWTVQHCRKSFGYRVRRSYSAVAHRYMPKFLADLTIPCDNMWFFFFFSLLFPFLCLFFFPTTTKKCMTIIVWSYVSGNKHPFSYPFWVAIIAYTHRNVDIIKGDNKMSLECSNCSINLFTFLWVTLHDSFIFSLYFLIREKEWWQ